MKRRIYGDGVMGFLAVQCFPSAPLPPPVFPVVRAVGGVDSPKPRGFNFVRGGVLLAAFEGKLLGQPLESGGRGGGHDCCGHC